MTKGDDSPAGTAAGAPAEQGQGDHQVFTADSGEQPAQGTSAFDLLARINLFAGLPAVFLRRIAALGEEESFPRGALIFSEGEPGHKMYLIVEGAVRIARTIPGMGEEALAILQTGDYFGEMALIDDFPRSADARAHEASRLLVITKEQLADLLFVDRDLAYDVLWNFVRTLSGRLRGTNDKMTLLAVSSKF